MNFEKGIEMVEKLLELDGGGSPESIATILMDVYNHSIKKFRPLIKAAPLVLPIVVNDLIPVVVAFLRLRNEIAKNSDCSNEQKKWNTIRAEKRMEALDAYMNAGFKREEAMSLVLQDIANAKTSSAYDNISSAKNFLSSGQDSKMNPK